MAGGVRELSEFCSVFGLEYVLERDVCPIDEFDFATKRIERRSDAYRRGYVQLVNPRSGKKNKKVQVLFPDNTHSAVLTKDGRFSSIAEGCPRTDDEIADEALSVLYGGVRLKVSGTKTVPIPAVSGLEELKLRLYASGVLED